MNDVQNRLLKNHNNFDALRLFAAAFVLLSHAYDVRGIGNKEPLVSLTSGHYSFSAFGLAIFFVISGFLVSRSLDRSASVKAFLYKRFLRIWPGLFLNIVLVTLMAGAFFSVLPFAVYLTDPLMMTFVLVNISMLKTSLILPGVFDGQPVNISLWTIPVEVRLYILLVIVYTIRFFKHRVFLLIVWVCALLCLLSVTYSFSFMNKIPKQLIWDSGLGIYFLTGCLFYLYRERLRFRFSIWIIALSLWAIVGYYFHEAGHMLDFPFFAYTILYVALGIRPFRFIKTDLSYGIYLYAYPVQLMVRSVEGGHLNFIGYLFVVIIITLLLALASWHLIEKTALKKKPL